MTESHEQCETCGTYVAPRYLCGNQCFNCYHPDAPRMTLREWRNDGYEPQRFVRIREGDPR